MNGDLEHLNDLEKRLYGQKKGLPKSRPAILPKKAYGVPTAWQEKMEKQSKKVRLPASFLKKFFFIALGFFVLAAGISLFIFFSGGSVVSPENITITVSGTSFAVGGEKLPLLIEVENNNRLDLELADLVVEYPKGGFGTEMARIRESLETIPAMSVVSRVVEPVLLGEEGSAKELRIALEYRLKNSNAIFVKETKHSVVLSSSPILIAFEGPLSVTADQEFVFNIKVTSNATSTLSNLSLALRYPNGFIFSESTPKPFFGNNFFELGDLATGNNKSIQVRGRLSGGEGESRTFAVEVGEADRLSSGKINTVLAAKIQTLLLTSPFVEARILVNGIYDREYVAASQADIPVEISWANNTNTSINNLEIRAKISGLFDETSINTSDGFYDSSTDTVVFNQNTNSDFTVIAPGGRGSVGFSLSSSPLFQNNNLATDPQIVIETSIKGLQPTLGVTNEVNNFERRIIKLSSELAVLPKALHFSGPITNTGPVPPKAEMETTYTIVWAITNGSNAVTGAKVSAILPPYVKFIGNTTPSSESVSFNESAREVVWRAGQISRGVGLTTSPREVAFKVALLPSLSQVGSTLDLTGDAILTGVDTFTKKTLQTKRRGPNTNLTDDPGFPVGGGIVTQ